MNDSSTPGRGRVTAHIIGVLGLVGLLGALPACDGGGAKGAVDVVSDTTPAAPALARVETTVTPDVVSAGESVSVACRALDQYDADFEASLAFEVYDANGHLASDGVTVAGDEVSFTVAGSFRVMCVHEGPPRVEDTSPVEVVVEAGGAVSIQTSLFLTDLTAGQTVSVGCTVKDANGNAASAETTVRVSPEDGATVTGRSVRFTGAGAYSVVCALADGSLVGDDPVAVTVSPGPLKVLRTVLTPDTIHPGERVAVTCPGEDAFGNPVALEKIITLPVDGLDATDASRMTLTTTRAGNYPITCVPKEIWVTPAEVPATLTVLAGDPTRLALVITPDRQVYAVGASVLVTPTLEDAWGNALTDLAESVPVEARFGGVLEETVHGGERVHLDTEGFWDLSAATGAPWNLTATRRLAADASAPSIDVTYPARGAMITTNGSTITLSGVVRDATGGLASVRVNGVPQAITTGQQELTLAIPFSARHGLNTIAIEATDVGGQTTKIAQSFLAAPGWKKIGERFARGVLVHLDKKFLDDGVRGPKLDDLVEILGRVLAGFDIASFIPSPVVSYAGYDVYLENLRYDAPILALTPADGKLRLDMTIPNLAVDVDAQGFIDVSGRVTVNKIHITMDLALSVDQSGNPRVTAGTTVVDVQGLNIDVHWSINWLINFFEDDVRDALASSFTDTLKQQVPPAFQDALAALSIEQTFQVPAFFPGMLPINIDLAAKPTAIRATLAGLDLDLGSRVSTAKRVPWSAPGSFVRGGCFGADDGEPTWASGKRIGFGLTTDLLNQILFAAWWGGALEITMGEEQFAGMDLGNVPVSDLSVVVSGHMPPVLTDCLDDQLHLQIGELQVALSLSFGGQPMNVTMVMAFEALANVSVSPEGELGLSLGAINPGDVVIDVTSVDSPLFSIETEDALVQLLREQLLGQLLTQIAGQSLAGFQLPEIDLGQVSPALSGQVISIHDIALERQRGYVTLQGSP
ncbi:MAG: hypothetical protein H6745_01840 [Deltaproteobacteria bacterium]|nr:hypothetical protein [Deltaproteobacteria bacterium]